MKRLLETFFDCFNAKLPPELYPRRDEIPNLDSFSEKLLIKSKDIVSILRVLQSVRSGRGNCRKGSFALGFWGHGICSNGFVFLRIGENRKISLRLPYGNAYSDNEALGQAVARYLTQFVQFEKSLPAQAEFLAYEHMYSAYYCISLPGGILYETDRPIFLRSSFEKEFEFLLKLLRKQNDA